MTGVSRSHMAAATVTVALLAVTGCTGSSTAEPQPASTSSKTSKTPDPSPGFATDDTTAETTGGPSPGSMVTPDVTAGPLSQASFPTPRRLGPGWRYSVDPGDAEEGYAGNGTPVLERYAEEIVQTAVPFGCDRRKPMRPPVYALEVDYSFRGSKVIAVRSDFRDRGAARAFFVARSDNLRDCLGRSGSAAIGPLVGRLTKPAADALASDRTPRSDPWRELAVLDGSTVALVAVQGIDRLTDSEARRLVTLFRR